YPAPAKAEAPLSDYTGVYQVHRNGLDIAAQISDMPVYINITISANTLHLQQTGSEKITLRPAGKDRFLPLTSENTLYIFVRDEKGKVSAITTRGTFWTNGPEVLNKRLDKAWPQRVVPKAVSAGLLEKYSGTYYHPSMDHYVFIETDGTKLYNRVQNRRQELIPVADNKFVRKEVEDINFEFTPIDNGSFVLTLSGLRTFRSEEHTSELQS